ncbi:tRNA modification GTPase [Flavobacterium humi]|uniref:tRNA modification GTPase n=1 Tax=Flavobacterium humi TaxID=2562683 RepID=A0A4Z0LAP1_9FLAO|nr:tRNA modification GTPase [Flavobacterium humi]TGD59112.1 tRNA modification GTPase [Flavobacterium humi]
MKKQVLAIFLLIYSYAQAQITFEKGYFISNGSKTECYIRNIDWKDNPTEFEYKTDLKEAASKAFITNVEEFGIDNSSKYKRFKINIERSSNDISDISKSSSPKWKEETLFLKVLIEGDATLYSYSEGNLYKYFFETKNVPTEQLIRIKYINLTPVPGQNYADDSLKENNQFRQQLFNGLKSEAISEEDIKNVSYTKSSLVKIFKKYNSSTGSATMVSFESKSDKDLLAVKITAGIDQASLKLTDPNTYYNASNEVKGETIFKIGAELEYTLPFNKNTWSVFINPAYQKYEAEKNYTRDNGFGVILPHTLNVEYSSVELPIGIRHHIFLNKTSKIFINGAFVFSAFGGNATFDFDHGKTIFEGTSRNNFAFGAGYSFQNRYSIEFRVNTAREILGYQQWSAKYSSIGIILAYKIF